jgi:hypothetical protein
MAVCRLVHQSWSEGCGPWVADREARVVGRGPWAVHRFCLESGREPWVVGRGPWPVGRGPRVVGRESRSGPVSANVLACVSVWMCFLNPQVVG